MHKILNDAYDREEYLYKNEFATKSRNSKGRERELSPDFRTEFQRDTHRIYYSQPFRRLRHKTQVFYYPKSDHISTRLEHALFVTAAARTIARALKLNEDLAEAIGLGHDLGHAPFGHHGEGILNEICDKKMNSNFDHEVNSLRVVDKLAQLDREEPPGLALTYEVRDGIVSHDGEDFSQAKIIPHQGNKKLDQIKKKRDAKNPTTLEGCIVRMADKIAYAGRDIEDGIQAELIKPNDIPKSVTRILGDNNGAIVGTLVRDVIKNTPPDENYVAMSEKMFEVLNTLLDFNKKRIYNHDKVQEYKNRVEVTISNLFSIFMETLDNTERFNNDSEVNKIRNIFIYKTFETFVRDMEYTKEDSNAQIAVDFISGFTDNFVIRALNEIFVPESIV